LNVLFVKVSLKNPADDAITFTKSFFKAAFKIDLNLDECKAAVEDPFEKIIDAVKKMASGSIEDIKTAIAELMVAIPALINSFSTCEQAWPQIEAGLEQLKTFVITQPQSSSLLARPLPWTQSPSQETLTTSMTLSPQPQ
jgi:hypothetical protein